VFTTNKVTFRKKWIGGFENWILCINGKMNQDYYVVISTYKDISLYYVEFRDRRRGELRPNYNELKKAKKVCSELYNIYEELETKKLAIINEYNS